MGGRDKNFEEDQSDRDIRKTRYGRRRFFSNHPLAISLYFLLHMCMVSGGGWCVWLVLVVG